MSQIQYIPVEMLSPHPANPRKDLGELTELAESIKANGIMQNLTVVSFDGAYRVIIGHRRMAAARLAGLTELPCVVTEMDERQQVATMLAENIQRSDLTPYEQAQGFQMMLDLGDSVDDIATRTGFSESTVRRRVKLLELDANKFKESEARGASLFEYMELEKIADLDRRNAVLDKIGTDNFKYELKRALDKQQAAQQMAALVARLSEFATEVESRSEYSGVKTYYACEGVEAVETPEDAGEVAYYFWQSDYSNWISLLKERTISPEDDAAQAQRESEESARRERLAQLKEIAERAYALRREFIKSVNVTTIKKNLAAILSASILERLGGGYRAFDDADFLALLDVQPMDEADEGYAPEAEQSRITDAIAAAPMRALLYAAYCDFRDSGEQNYYQHYHGVHSENDRLNRLYDLLETLGYAMSDDERAMRDGTHEVFGVGAEPEVDCDVPFDIESGTDAERAA